MASSPTPQNSQAGYATPAALLLSLGLAMVGSAMTVRSVTLLNLSRADLDRSRQEFALDGAHLQAVAQVIRSGQPGPYRWTFGSDLGWMEATVEPEADKLALDSVGALDDGLLQAMGVQDAAALRARLASAPPKTDLDIAGLDPAPMWRACAPSLVSVLGRADHVQFLDRREPGPGPDPGSWHVGEAWRVKVTTSAGWRDDRIVRFTGDARHPAAIVARRLTRGGSRGGECEQLFKDPSGA